MPVRIYDISKKLGLENKAILAKAKSLGIAAARVPSSSLDKISASISKSTLHRPPRTRRQARPAAAARAKAAPSEPIVVIKPPPPEPSQPEVKEEPPPVVEAPKPHRHRQTAGPKVGEKSGSFNYGTPAARRQNRPGQILPSRPGVSGRPGSRQGFRSSGGRQTAPPAREPAKPAAAPQPKFVAPTTGEVIIIKPPIVVRELALQLKQKPFKIIADLMELGVFANVNQAIDEKIAQQLCANMVSGLKWKNASAAAGWFTRRSKS